MIKKENFSNEMFETIGEDRKFEKMNIDWKASTYTIMDLITYVEEGDIYLPEFQRNYVWDKNMANEFIESLLMNLPIPSIYLSSREEGNSFYVIDGFQRITTIFSFIKLMKFRNNKVKGRLKSNNPDGSNKSFDELDIELQKLLKRTQINVITIDIKKSDKYSIFNIFARINKGGTKLSEQQIRNSIYLSKNLREVNNYAECLLDSKFISISKKKIDENYHQELLLRIFALKFFDENEFAARSMTLTNRLNLVAERISNIPSNEFKKDLDSLKSTIKIMERGKLNFANIELKNGKYIFKNALSPLVFESVIYSSGKLENMKISNKSLMEMLKKDILIKLEKPMD